MLLESLKQFDWMNEPVRVRFDDRGMHVTAKSKTDFWNCVRYNFIKDDGHFFFSYVSDDFCCELNWEFETSKLFDQSGIMLRIDENNWFKASIMYDNDLQPMMATSLTNMGFSDLATINLQKEVNRVWYRLKRYKGCYVVSYSVNGEEYIQLRKFYLIKDEKDVKVGAYICSPQQEDFEATLNDIKLL